MSILYRVRQFWRTISLKTDPDELEQAIVLLSKAQEKLFLHLQPGEQRHALVMYNKLLEQGENQPDLLVAALLHDVGKLRYRMNPVERAMVVLTKAVLPGQVRRWGSLPSSGFDRAPSWRKVFIQAELHAQWGAELARKAGVSPLTESLIRTHHTPASKQVKDLEDSLRYKLWLVDNES